MLLLIAIKVLIIGGMALFTLLFATILYFTSIYPANKELIFNSSDYAGTAFKRDTPADYFRIRKSIRNQRNRNELKKAMNALDEFGKYYGRGDLYQELMRHADKELLHYG